jgi:2-amino-4-hydroxy-6-hydroxymethyldihydropteridine diphosphokinase
MNAAPQELAALALGSNLGDRGAHLAAARDRIAASWGPLLGCSGVYETDPVGPPGQGAYLNQVVVIAFGGTPEELLRGALEIEDALGRRRAERWGPRTIDVDLLLHGDRVRSAPGFELPHARLHERPFVLVPLAEVLPDWRHPRLGSTARELAAAADRAGVRPFRTGGTPAEGGRDEPPGRGGQ